MHCHERNAMNQPQKSIETKQKWMKMSERDSVYIYKWNHKTFAQGQA